MILFNIHFQIVGHSITKLLSTLQKYQIHKDERWQGGYYRWKEPKGKTAKCDLGWKESYKKHF